MLAQRRGFARKARHSAAFFPLLCATDRRFIVNLRQTSADRGLHIDALPENIKVHSNRPTYRISPSDYASGWPAHGDCLRRSKPVNPAKIYYPLDPTTLLLKIDKGKAVPWPHKTSLKIDGLSLTERHRVVLFSGGKPLQSFWFRFAQYKSEELCLSFDGYGGPELQEAKGAP